MPGWPEPGLEDSTFLLLADPFSTPIQEVLSLMDDRYPHGKAVGGLAGGGQDSGENRLLLNDQSFDGGVVGVQLTGPITVRTVTSQGCRPIGERFVVTRAEQNLIYELGGVSALKRLQDVFESLGGAQRRDAHRALHLGIVIAVLVTGRPILLWNPQRLTDAPGGGALVWAHGKQDADGLVKPKAFVVLRQAKGGGPALAGEIQEHVKQQLAHYKYPRQVEFITELPKKEDKKGGGHDHGGEDY